MVQLHCNPLKEAHISTIGQSKVRLGKLGKRLIKPIKEFIEDDMASYAAALSFWVFFSLFPFILFLVALLSFLGIPGFFDWLVERAQTVMPEQAMGQVEETVGQIRSGASGGLLSFVVVVALWPASAAVRMAMHALNVAYDVKEARAAWKRFSLSIVYTILLAAMVIVAVGLMLVGPRVMEWLCRTGRLGPVVRHVLDVASLPCGHPAAHGLRGAGLLHVSQHQPAVPVHHAGCDPGRNRLVGRFVRLLVLCVNLREFKCHLRWSRRDHRAAPLHLHLCNGVAFRRGGERGDLPAVRRWRGRGREDTEEAGPNRLVVSIK